MKKTLLFFNVLLPLTIFIGTFFYITQGGLMIKTLCSGGFVLLGIINFASVVFFGIKRPTFHFCMLLGLFLAMLGDVLLELNFVVGALFFAFGHIGYLTAYCFLTEPKASDWIIGGGIAFLTGIFVLFFPLLNFTQPFMRWVCFVYAIIISIMTGKAISNFIRNKNLVMLVLLIGSVLFFFSDLMLVFRLFMDAGAWARKLCLATYYPAQCLLASSILLLLLPRQGQKYNL